MEAYQPYIEAWRRRQRREAQEARRARQRARLDAQRIAHFLGEKYGVERVVLFGSVLGERFGPASDIDLAVEGLDPSRYFRALSEASALSEFPVEIKLLGECRGLIRRRIDEEGEVLLEV